MQLSHDEYDVVVIGAGAGGMTAAAVAATRGLRPIVIEKTDVVGGTTAISGGMVWAPSNPMQALVGAQDTPQQAVAYLEAVVGSSEGADLRRHYLAALPKAINYLEQHTHVRLTPVPFSPGQTCTSEVASELAGRARPVAVHLETKTQR